MKLFRGAFLTLIFLVFLLPGFHLGVKWGTTAGVASDRLPATTVTPAATILHQRNLLIIGVDRLQEPAAELKSLWLVIYYPDKPRVDLLPIFPSIQEKNPMQSQTIAITSRNEPTGAFWDQIEGRDILWHGYVLVDKEIVNAITASLDVAGNYQGAFEGSGEEDPLGSLKAQARFWRKFATDSRALPYRRISIRC